MVETFKKKLKTRIAWLAAAIAGIAVTYSVLLILGDRLPPMTGPMMRFREEFAAGAFIGLIANVLIHIAKTASYLRSDAALEERYIKENDERKRLIMQKTGSVGFQISGIGLGFAAVVAAFFDLTVFFTLMGAILFLLAVKLSLWLYYERKY